MTGRRYEESQIRIFYFIVNGNHGLYTIITEQKGFHIEQKEIDANEISTKRNVWAGPLRKKLTRCRIAQGKNSMIKHLSQAV